MTYLQMLSSTLLSHLKMQIRPMRLMIWQLRLQIGYCWSVRCKLLWFFLPKCIYTGQPEPDIKYIHPFNGPFSRTTQVSWYQKGKTNMDFTEARDSEWQWHQLGNMQICTSLQTDNHANTPPLSFYRPDALPAAEPTASKHWSAIVMNKATLVTALLQQTALPITLNTGQYIVNVT